MRIDYRFNAQERIKVALKDRDCKNALVTAQIATAEATLALAEQQRIANLIALATLPAESVGSIDRDAGLRAEIREGLGL